MEEGNEVGSAILVELNRSPLDRHSFAKGTLVRLASQLLERKAFVSMKYSPEGDKDSLYHQNLVQLLTSFPDRLANLLSGEVPYVLSGAIAFHRTL
jgi:hypothetical protein